MRGGLSKLEKNLGGGGMFSGMTLVMELKPWFLPTDIIK